MTYYSEYDLAFLDIMKNGSNVFIKLFEYVIGRKADEPFFVREPQIYLTVVRNPYDRLVTQFYHANRKILGKEYSHSIHYPFFRKWVKDTYKNGYDGDDGHMFAQNHIIQYYEWPLPYKVFKLEELVPHELFFFLELDDERKADIDAKFLEIKRDLDNSRHHASGNLKQGIWQVFYDAESIEVCNNYFAKDFEAFNYEIIDPNKWETPKRSMV
jgi:hypothetical protein